MSHHAWRLTTCPVFSLSSHFHLQTAWTSPEGLINNYCHPQIISMICFWLKNTLNRSKPEHSVERSKQCYTPATLVRNYFHQWKIEPYDQSPCRTSKTCSSIPRQISLSIFSRGLTFWFRFLFFIFFFIIIAFILAFFFFGYLLSCTFEHRLKNNGVLIDLQYRYKSLSELWSQAESEIHSTDRNFHCESKEYMAFSNTKE